MDSLKDIIELCHQRREKPLQQRRTVVSHAMYNKYSPHQYTVYCAHKCPILLSDFEQADISFMPIGHAPNHDCGPWDFGGERFLKRQRMIDWQMVQWDTSWGVQIYTGIPSEHNGARWNDLNFTYEVICSEQEAVYACIEGLINAAVNPLLTITESGGLRFSCRIPNYLHPNTDESRYFIHKHTPTAENPHERQVYLEIIGEKGYSCWDARYDIILGNLLDPPVISDNAIFAHVDTLRDELHSPASTQEELLNPVLQTVTVTSVSLGSSNLDFAKAALLKRGFSYVRQDNGRHCWCRTSEDADDVHVSLWEDEGTVWLRSSTPKAGLPTEATHITEIWVDTGIVPPVTEELKAVREGKLSPLAIKRPKPVLQSSEKTEIVYETLEENANKIQSIFDRDARILGIFANKGIRRSHEIDTFLPKNGEIILNVSGIGSAKDFERYYQRHDVSSHQIWKPRIYQWEQVQDIPIEVRMANPFQHGNMCEDAERCTALQKKGGEPLKSICPQCQVYTECNERGYLAQHKNFQHTKIKIIPSQEPCYNPAYVEFMDSILEQPKPTDNEKSGERSVNRICIVDEVRTFGLFPKIEISINMLEEWNVFWQGSVLGNFAKALLNVLQLWNEKVGIATKRVRATVYAFRRHEEELITQMCSLNINAKVVPQVVVDAETGIELAHFTVLFDRGVSAYIPLDKDAAKILMEKSLPVIELSDFAVNEDMKIPMRMEQAIRLGILDVATVESIDTFPTVCWNPNWTTWHQLKCFFDYYIRDEDTPMKWDHELLAFHIPPVLHPSVSRILFISSTLSEQHLKVAFPKEEIETFNIKPTVWCQGNQIFQLRTGLYDTQNIYEYDTNREQIRPTKMGRRFIYGIRSEIERDANIKHAIITHKKLTNWMVDILDKKNVCFIKSFRAIEALDKELEETDVLWIISTPNIGHSTMWRKAQILFGNDAEPLSYEIDTEILSYKDKRIQCVYEEEIFGILSSAIGSAKLTHYTNKKIVLGTSFPLPGVTERPETLLFDWEDLEVAGGLDKLPEAIATRQRFEAEKATITAETSRTEVERILGCSSRQANRVLSKLRGGNIPRVLFREQIISILADGAKKTSEIAEAIEGHPKAVNSELTRLVVAGDIVKVRRGMYALPTS